MKFRLMFVLIAFISTHASAAVDLDWPMFDIQNGAGDSGFSTDGTTMEIDATLQAALQAPGVPLDGPAVTGDVYITADFIQTLNPNQFSFGNGVLSVTDGADLLLSATFSDMIISVNSSLSQAFLATDLTYTGGLFAVGLSEGRLEGAVFNLSALDLSGVATATTTILKVGEISNVPLPMAGYLLGGALLVMFRFFRRA